MDILFVDFETHYDTKSKYDLKSISMTEYIRHPKFKVFGMGYSWQGQTGWIRSMEVEKMENLPDLMDIDWSHTAVCAHNVKFDGAILSWKYGIQPMMFLDTQSLARAILGPSIGGYSLQRLAEYLGCGRKGELATDGLPVLTWEQEKTLSDYCKNDTYICRQIWEKLSPKFPESQLFSMDWCARAFIEPKLVLDTNKLQEAVKDERTRRNNAILASGATKSELASNKRFAELVARRGYAVPTKTSPRTGKIIPAFSRSDGGLENLGGLDPNLYAARLAAKSTILETKGTKLYEISKTGPWPFDVQFSGAVQTHRYSGGAGAGGNPQNFPRNGPLREAVCVPPEQYLVVGDFAQIEARLVSWLAGEPRLMSVFREERDVYSEFATMLYKRPITKADEVERRFGKEAILGLGYNMGWAKFQARVKQALKQDISDERAREIVFLYRDTYFNIPRLWQRAQMLLPLLQDGRKNVVPFAPFLRIEKETIILPSGLPMRYPNLRVASKKFMNGEWRLEWVYDHFVKKHESEPVKIYGGKIVENICQALAGEITKIAIERAEVKGLRVVGQVHDEIICITEETLVNESANTLQEVMEQPVSWLPSLKLKADVGYGKTWAEAKK